MRSVHSLRALAAAAAAMPLVACSGDGGAAPGAQTGAETGVAAESDELRVGPLEARELSSGQCGLFLWTRATPPELVFFANPDSGEAAVVVDGRERALQRLDADSPDAGARPGSQTFATSSGDVSVRLTVLESEQVQDGYRVTSASLRFAGGTGWSGVMPAAGLAACRP